MPRLQILVHKSYHPYLESNKQKVRDDEAKAAAELEAEERRMLDADSEARLDILRRRAVEGNTSSSSSALMPSGTSSLLSSHRSSRAREDRRAEKKKLEFDWPIQDKTAKAKGKERNVTDLNTADKGVQLGEGGGHINFWAGMEKESAVVPASSSKPKPKPTPDEIQDDDPTTMYLNRPERETKPWYTDPELRKYDERQEGEDAKARRERRKKKEERNKQRQDPMSEVQSALAAVMPPPKPRYATKSSAPVRSLPPSAVADPLLAARLQRESAEKARATQLVEAARRRAAAMDSATPRSSVTGQDEFSDLWNEREVKDARRRREMAREHRGRDDWRRRSWRDDADEFRTQRRDEWRLQPHRADRSGGWEV